MITLLENYSLRRLSIDDAEGLFKILDSQREYMREWLPFVDNNRRVEDLQTSITSFATKENPQFCIMCDEEVVGLIGFKDTSENDSKTEIGYWLSRLHQGKGVMTKAVTSLLHDAFVERNMNRVVIKAAVENKKSRSIPERLGFVQEGVERESELLVNQVYADIVVYSMLKKEYLENKNKWK